MKERGGSREEIGARNICLAWAAPGSQPVAAPRPPPTRQPWAAAWAAPPRAPFVPREQRWRRDFSQIDRLLQVPVEVDDLRGWASILSHRHLCIGRCWSSQRNACIGGFHSIGSLRLRSTTSRSSPHLWDRMSACHFLLRSAAHGGCSATIL